MNEITYISGHNGGGNQQNIRESRIPAYTGEGITPAFANCISYSFA
jgi:hypothetical protein